MKRLSIFFGLIWAICCVNAQNLNLQIDVQLPQKWAKTEVSLDYFDFQKNDYVPLKKAKTDRKAEVTFHVPFEKPTLFQLVLPENKIMKVGAETPTNIQINMQDIANIQV